MATATQVPTGNGHGLAVENRKPSADIQHF